MANAASSASRSVAAPVSTSGAAVKRCNCGVKKTVAMRRIISRTFSRFKEHLPWP